MLIRRTAIVLLAATGIGVAGWLYASQWRPSEADYPRQGIQVSRTQGNIDWPQVAAQRQIEVAASLAPADPEVGLEAGVVAMLAGREAAARKSWESVVRTAPASKAAATAKDYLAQLGVAEPPPPAR